jgi:hypothetical protein
MQLTRMTTRRWMVATAFAAVLSGGILRAQALQRRAAFHAWEKQSCLQKTRAAEKEYRWMQEEGGRWCGSRVLFVEIEEDYEAAPELRERAAYHSHWEAAYRRAARYPWLSAPAETSFVPDDRMRSPDWLRAKAQTYRTLERTRRGLAGSADSPRSKEQILLAEADARAASDYDRRARQRECLNGPVQ